MILDISIIFSKFSNEEGIPTGPKLECLIISIIFDKSFLLLVLDEKLYLSGQLKFKYRRVLNLLLSSTQSHISRQRSRIPSAYHNTYMKANLRDKGK